MEKTDGTVSLFSVELREDGIVHVKISSREEIDLPLAKKIIAAIGKKCADRKRPVLLSSESFAAPTAEARAYMAKAEANPYSSASAYIARSLAEKLVTNAYIRFNKPARPTRMFTSETKALEWLKSFI
ncbi:MAG: hypothetical protein JWO44_2135 [Bacteroidetes bacterium]|nr:hypothetical protein [Bacteroidota bacterium]